MSISFKYVEPCGKDMGIDVREKAENVVALLNNKEKIQEGKAAANREKYIGLSSSGVTYKASTASFSSSSSSGFQSSERYGGFGNKSVRIVITKRIGMMTIRLIKVLISQRRDLLAMAAKFKILFLLVDQRR